MRDFKKYEIWQLSHNFALEIYKCSQDLPAQEKYHLVSQMQRAAVSVPTNIAEGCGRQSDKEFNRFLQIALGSAHELEYFMILLHDLDYISQDRSQDLIRKINEIKMKIFSLSQRLLQ